MVSKFFILSDFEGITEGYNWHKTGSYSKNGIQRDYYQCSTKKGCPVKKIVSTELGSTTTKYKNEHNHPPLGLLIGIVYCAEFILSNPSAKVG